MPSTMAPRKPALPNLTAIRERKGISLDQIATSTKISSRYLEAIERSDVDQLPGGVFRTSYIRQYARAIDYDEWDLLAHFGTLAQAQQEEPEAPPPHKLLGMLKVPQPLMRWLAPGKRA